MVADISKHTKHTTDTRHAAFHSLVFFLFLLILPVTASWLVLSSVQENLEKDGQQQCLDEMAEITAHIGRLANHETFFQESLRRLSDSFRWASSPAEIPAFFDSAAADVYLFDHEGHRIPWPDNESGKRKISEDYMRILLNLRRTPGLSLPRRDQSIATAFSGNAATAHILSRAPETLVNFQGLGLRKYAIWLEPRLSWDMSSGHLLAWVYPDKVDRYLLARRAIRKISRLAGKDYVFAWLDLNNKDLHECSGQYKIKPEGLKILSTEGLKSGFRLEDELFSIYDTPEGIRLICSRHVPRPPAILSTFTSILQMIIPVIILFMLWKTAFMVRLGLSAGVQFALIFGFTAITGVAMLLAGTMAWQYEKQNSLVAEYKQRGVQILEKIDRNFSASYGDLLRQYRHLTKKLSNAEEPISKILAPLAAACREENLDFASYTDRHGNFLFKVPETKDAENRISIESKYASLISGVSSQVIKGFNSSKISGNAYEADPIGVKTLSSKPVEGLLANRSTLQNITFDGDETLTFVDLTIDEHDIASGCLFIVHEPRKMELKYLAVSSGVIKRSTGFSLAAFPKKHSDRSTYYPRYSLTTELPLWKLQDLVNLTQVSSFKTGRVEGKEAIVAAISGHNLKNYNLFLIMPLEPIKKEAMKLSIFFVVSTALALTFITFLGLMLVKSLIHPIIMLAANASALTSGKECSQPTDAIICEANELESISTGLTDLIIKVREFNEGRSIKRHLLPPEALQNSFLKINGLQISRSSEEKEIYHFASISENLSLVFLMRTDLSGIEASLNLSMARMAVRLLSEELNIHSAFHCLKDLEEYFRINLRRKLCGQMALLVINHEEKILSWSGCGKITLMMISDNNAVTLLPDLPDCEPGHSSFLAYANKEIPFCNGQTCIVLSPAIQDSCVERLQLLLPALKDRAGQPPLIELMTRETEKVCSSLNIDSASMVIIETFKKPEESA